MTTITNKNIRRFVRLYINDKRSKLPPDLRNIPIGDWNVSNVTDMSDLFNDYDYESFNEPLNWDVSNVINMDSMFSGCYDFNQDLSKWNVSKVEFMNNMFEGCDNFNQDLSRWNVSSVKYMCYMFSGCYVFNQDLSKWDVSSVREIFGMFERCRSFNQDLSNWDVSNVNKEDAHYNMFLECPISEENKPIFKDDPNYLQRKQQKEQQKQNKIAYEVLPEISQSRKLPEQINTAIGSYLIDDDLPMMNQKLLQKNTKTVIDEEPDVKMGIGGRKSRKLRKKRKATRKSRRKLRK